MLRLKTKNCSNAHKAFSNRCQVPKKCRNCARLPKSGGPLVNPVEMANDSQEAAAAKIAKIPEYQELFKTAFPEDGAVSFKNITAALGAFERTLLTTTSKATSTP